MRGSQITEVKATFSSQNICLLGEKTIGDFFAQQLKFEFELKFFRNMSHNSEDGRHELTLI